VAIISNIACNGFSFKESRNSHWACGCSSLYLLPFSRSSRAGMKGTLKLFWCQPIRSPLPALRSVRCLLCCKYV